MSDETKPETPDAKKDGPDYRPTKQIPKVEIQANQFSELKSIMVEGFAKVDTAIFDLGERVVRVEIRQKDLEDRMARHSGGTRQLSDVDAKHDAAIGTLVAKVTDLETSQSKQTEKLVEIEKKTDVQTQMLTKAGSYLKDPKVIALALFAYTLIKSFAHKQGVELP